MTAQQTELDLPKAYARERASASLSGVRLYRALATWGPGIIVMLADTDAGCLITAAQSGAQYGYSLIALQVLLIPLLYAVQEITVRLGLFTGKGHGALIRERFGMGWALISSLTLLASAVGALCTEFDGIAGVGQLCGLSKWLTVPLAAALLIGLAFFRSYKRVERIGIAVGILELAFVVAMFMVHHDAHSVLHGLTHQPFSNFSYLQLVAGNVGAVIMPWMIFYQQAAVLDRGLSKRDLPAERKDTLVGSFITQLIMIATIAAMAATAYRVRPGMDLNTVPQLAHALSLGIAPDVAKVLVGAAMLGGSMVAALVVTLAGAWGMAEVFGWRHSLNEGISRKNAPFYLTYSLSHVVGAVLVLFSVDLVGLAVDVEVMNALLLPIVLGFLLALERRALPDELRMRGIRRFVITAACLIVMAFGVFMAGMELMH